MNTSGAAHTMPLPEGSWQVLADGQSSWLWQQERCADGHVQLAAASAMILGRKMT